jgi:hypothetical protein
VGLSGHKGSIRSIQSRLLSPALKANNEEQVLGKSWIAEFNAIKIQQAGGLSTRKSRRVSL